jgi:parvulin-like peptidyl-prolyl isomerase
MLRVNALFSGEAWQQESFDRVLAAVKGLTRERIDNWLAVEEPGQRHWWGGAAIDGRDRGRAALIMGVLGMAEPAAAVLKRSEGGEAAPPDPQGPSRVHVRHVQVKDRHRAEALRAQLLQGTDFGLLAGRASICPSAAQGGDLGTFGRGVMEKPFEDAAFTQPVGTIGPVIQTSSGWHIIQVIERDPVK